MTKKLTLKQQHIIDFAEAGFRLCRLGHRDDDHSPVDFDLKGKIPGLGFTKVKHDPKPNLKKFPHNYGVVLDHDTLVIDVDPRNFRDGVDSLKKLETDLCINLRQLCGFINETGGGGLHFYYRKPANIRVRNELKDEYPGIEFKSGGRQVVGPGSIHPETLKPYRVIKGTPHDLRAAPAELIDLIRRQAVQLDKGLAEYDDSETNMNLTRSALKAYPAAIEGQGGDETTLRAVYLCRDNGVSPEAALELLEEYNQRCEPPWEFDDLATKVRNGYRYAQNAPGVHSVKADFDDVKIDDEDLAPIKDKVDPKPEAAPVAQPDFLDEIEDRWCYSIGTKTFFDLRDMSEWDKEQFDDIHSGRTDKKKPSAFAIGYPKMVKVTAPTYWPGQERYVEEDGKLRINLYRKPNIVAHPGDVTMFKEFVSYLVGEDKAWIIHDFIAYLLRNPGDKILWAVLLQGSPGVGKSVLAYTMRELFGHKNTVQPTNQQIHEKYTGWLKSCQLVTVHELMAMGRLEMLNKLKDPITEPTIQIREMFKPTYEIRNRANFFFLTNHEDAIVIPRDDRRFVVIFSPAQPRAKAYYRELIAWLNDNRAALYHYYLYEHQYDEKFDAKAPAIMTREKQRMIEATRHPIEAAINDAVEDGTSPFHGRLVNINDVLDTLRRDHRYLNYMTLSSHLKNCGFVPVTERMRLGDGRRIRLWAKAGTAKMMAELNTDQIRAIFVKQEAEFEETGVAKTLDDAETK